MLILPDQLSLPTEQMGGTAYGLLLLALLYALNLYLNWKGKQNGDCGLSREDRALLTKIREDVSWLKTLHDRADENGVPLVYAPRNLVRKMDDIVEQAADLKRRIRNLDTYLRGHDSDG